MVNNAYIVHKDTYALLPAKQIEYGTTIIDYGETIRERATPFSIIKESCLAYWSDYDGRRNAVIEKLGYKQKTPIPLSIYHKLCLFPTHSPLHIDNCWINYANIRTWGKIPKQRRNANEQIEVIFKNGVRIPLNVSAHTFRTQGDRAFQVMYQSGMVLREE